MFTLAHISDPHLAPLPAVRWSELIGKRITGYLNWERRRRFIHSAAALELVTADLKRQSPDHTVVTGDIANIGLPAEFTRGREWLEELGPARDVSFVPGNHDIYVRDAFANAARQWGTYMHDDDGRTAFPYVRRRENLALIGVSTGVPTAPLLATGFIGTRQLVELAAALNKLKVERVFRVIMIHHPPLTSAPRHKRLLDAAVLMRVIAEHGAELLVHGHDHRHMVNWLNGPNGSRLPAVGVPSASAIPNAEHDSAAYNLYRIGGEAGAWTCEIESRGLDHSGQVVQQKRLKLIG
ncbi:MAG TPA: metallophosphoesterase [Pseudolabrys sp.]|nr:metallophosphoesterase [Pseudolabrys sp.]